MWSLRRFSSRVFCCLCILDVVECLLAAVSFLCGVSKAAPPMGGIVGQDESCNEVDLGCLRWCAKFQLGDVVSPRDLVQGAGSASASH